ncbi:FecR family protein [Pedobacter faecalis]|uniref:FecR family protein n=1 Tax=Pedobacter faecalis TaxID=3041495 RepID=UPI0025514BC7|nr:FecR domain-containing protein [Pedobacter sp. ELA7]
MKAPADSLFAKYLEGKCSASETRTLLQQFGLAENERLLKEAILAELERDFVAVSESADLDARLSAIGSSLKAHITHNKETGKPFLLKFWPRVAIAAAAVATIVLSVHFFFPGYTDVTGTSEKIVYKNDVNPGTDAATLTLANGDTIQLNGSKKGVIIGGDIKYNDGDVVETGLAGSQELTAQTPRGGTYQFTLSDGTRVWMNAESKISFPSRFSGDQREVKLEGEAYFEVAKRAQPFVVATGSQKVEVLGTHFNIKGYTGDSDIRTTLLEGSVRVSRADERISEVIRPGEQAINRGNILVEKVDVSEAVAWKNGSTLFKERTLESIMRELSRWYDVQVVYEPGAPKQETYSGAVSRTRNLSAILERMQTTGSVRFRIEGKTVVVMK